MKCFMIIFAFRIKHCFVFVYFFIFLSSSHHSLHLKTLSKRLNSSHYGKKKKKKKKKKPRKQNTNENLRAPFVCFLGGILLRVPSLPPF